MYTFKMRREKLKQILQLYYSKDSVKSLISGRRTPSLEKAIMLEEKHNIPFKVWKDIKSFISTENSTTNDEMNSNTKNIKKVS